MRGVRSFLEDASEDERHVISNLSVFMGVSPPGSRTVAGADYVAEMLLSRPLVQRTKESRIVCTN
jgi:hypothetical protein